MKNRILLMSALVLSLLCICLQGWNAWQTDVETDAVLTQATVPLSQQPLEEERQYADNTLLCALSAGSCTTHHFKEGETVAGDLAADTSSFFQLTEADRTAALIHSPSDGRSVVIRLHHLII